jgi:hypothetical protein
VSDILLSEGKKKYFLDVNTYGFKMRLLLVQKVFTIWQVLIFQPTLPVLHNMIYWVGLGQLSDLPTLPFLHIIQSG